ncbi:hypothetical protein F0562_014009 [Nyssa sinensis]|uniref:Protein yippee-like n=1 Tax=Nyssa sinensis TaxID=561372 RepID=A0A5J4ZLM2_9ASTE|nr:hypothetical protein F0562_014009 [Nyssa sinensis]
MGRLFLVELEGRAYRCRCCDSPLALAGDVVYRSFNCSHILGRAYLFNCVVNVSVGPREERLIMLSGRYTVADIFCCCCGQILGWKYLAAHEKDQKSVEGKFVLEGRRIAEDIAEEFDLDPHPSSSDLSS